MIKLNKHSDLNLSIINISGLILKDLIENEMMSFNELLISLETKTSSSVNEVFISSLSFLFLIGKISYIQEIDGFKLKNENL